MFKIPFPELLEEFQRFEVRSVKAIAVYNRLMKAKKFELAERVAKKYKLHDHGIDDRVMAFGFSMLCSETNPRGL